MDIVNEISLDGFKIVSGDFFCPTSKLYVPSLTIWDGEIGFCKKDLLALNNCENIRIHVHGEDKKILLMPTTSNDKDAVHWVTKSNKSETRKLKCVRLTDKLFSSWGWDKGYIYRAIGNLVTAGSKVMLLFDFENCEKWKRPEVKNEK